MIRSEVLDTAAVPDGNGELQLLRRPLRPIDEFTIRVAGGTELMNSRRHSSEDALGTLGCAPLRSVPNARVLIGGLGMGFTVRAALDQLQPDACLIVAELVPEVVAWNKRWLGEVSGHPLQDDRVEPKVADVGALIKQEPASYDAILLDVDNGPEALTHESNAGLYSIAGLAQSHAALREGGALLVWSSSPDRAFGKRLNHAGFDVEEHRVRAHGRKGARHIVWRARRS